MAAREALREGPEWIRTTMLFYPQGFFNAGRAHPLITLGPDTRIAPRLGVLENSRFF